jgi:hypothetical protein
MSPEQLRGDRRLDARADVFALGCVLFECLARRAPFAGPNATSTIVRILLEDAPLLREIDSSIPPSLEEVVARALTRDREKRTASASELAAALRAVDVAPVAPPSVRPRLTATEQRVVSVVIAALTVADPDKAAKQATATPEQMSSLRAELQAAVEPYGASVETPGDAMLIAVLSGDGTPAEQAARAAHCALAIRRSIADAPMVLVTGLCVVGPRLPIGPIVDRALGELASAPHDVIRLDEATAELIDDRFDLRKTEQGIALVGARSVRTLLGQPTPYVGRERELGTVQAVLDECTADEVSRAVVVTGPPGMGKSRLVRETLARVHSRALTVLVGHGDAVAPLAAFGPLGRAIRAAAGVVGGDPEAARRARLERFLERNLPPGTSRVVPFLGELAGVPFDDDALRAARRDPTVMSDQIQRAWLQWLGHECAAKPVLLVLEDLHWSDPTTIRYVDLALDALADRPFMVLCTARPEVAELYPALFKTRALTELVLAGLSKRPAERLVRTVLGPSVSAEQVARIVERADGNAFFLEELVRCAAEGRAEGLPASMIGIVHARLAELDGDTRRALRAGSILGETFWAGAIAHLTAERPSAVAARIDDLVRRELLSPRPESTFSGEQELSFRHALVSEVAYATLTDDDRTLGHRLAGEWLEGIGAAPSMLASHYERGGDLSRAARCHERAAVAALEVNDLVGAIGHADRGLVCKPSPELATALRFVAARAYRWKGELGAADPLLREVWGALPVGSVRWFEAGADLVNLIARRGELVEASAMATKLLEAPWSPEARGVTRAIALARATHVIAYPTLMPVAQATLRSAQEEARATSMTEPGAVGQLRSAEWAYAMAVASFGDALRASRQAMRAFEAAGDMRTLVVESFGELASLCELGLTGEVITRAPASLERGASLGLHFSVALMRLCFGRALLETGDRAGARRELTASADWLRPRTPIAGWPMTFLTLCEIADGDLEKAERCANEAVLLNRTLPHGHPSSLASLASVMLASERGDEAVRHAGEALAIVDASPNPVLHEAFVRRIYVETNEAYGDREAAARELDVAATVCRERAARIEEPVWRQAFLDAPDQRFALRARRTQGT